MVEASKNNLSDFFHQNSTLLLNKLEACQKPRKNEIHDLRLALKYFYAIFELLKNTETIVHIDQLENELHTIFKAAGKIRSIQVYKGLLKSFQFSEAHFLNNVLNEQKLQYKQNFIALITTQKTDWIKRELETIYPLLLKVNDQVLYNEACSLIDVSLEEIEIYRGAKESEIEWHNIRKEIKTAIYTAKLLDHIKVNYPQKNIVKNLHSYERAIGKWHDLEMLLKHVNKMQIMMDAEANSKTIELRSEIKRQIEFEAKELYLFE